MPTKRVVVRSADGLHARPAAALAAAVAAARTAVTLTRADGDGDAVDAASMLSVMGLGLVHGDAVLLSSETPGTEALLDDLGTVIENAR